MGIKFQPDQAFRGYWQPKPGDELVGIVKKEARTSSDRAFFIIACESAGLDLRAFDESLISNQGDLVAVWEYFELRGLGRYVGHRVRIVCTGVREFGEGGKKFSFDTEIIENVVDEVPF